MAHIALPEVPVSGLVPDEVRVVGEQTRVQNAEELIEAGSILNGYIVNLVYGRRVVGDRCEHVGLHGIRYIAKITAALAISIDIEWLVPNHCGDPFRNDCRVGALWI